MPIYTYQCDKCGSVQEHIMKYAERDAPHRCPGACGGNLVREGVEQFALGKPSFQMGAVLGSGEKVKGHFGKSAPKKKSGWRPK